MKVVFIKINFRCFVVFKGKIVGFWDIMEEKIFLIYKGIDFLSRKIEWVLRGRWINWVRVKLVIFIYDKVLRVCLGLKLMGLRYEDYVWVWG